MVLVFKIRSAKSNIEGIGVQQKKKELLIWNCRMSGLKYYIIKFELHMKKCSQTILRIHQLAFSDDWFLCIFYGCG